MAITYPDFGTDFINARSPGRISGIDNLVKKIVRRLRSPTGCLYWDPAYGLDTRQYINSKLDNAKLQEIKQSVKAQCELDERVQSAEVTVANSANNNLFITIQITTQLGPDFSLVLSVTKLTLELLNSSLTT